MNISRDCQINLIIGNYSAQWNARWYSYFPVHWPRSFLYILRTGQWLYLTLGYQSWWQTQLIIQLRSIDRQFKQTDHHHLNLPDHPVIRKKGELLVKSYLWPLHYVEGYEVVVGDVKIYQLLKHFTFKQVLKNCITYNPDDTTPIGKLSCAIFTYFLFSSTLNFM